MTNTEMTVRMSESQIALFRDKRKLVKTIKCFEYDGTFFKGDADTAAMEFAYNNPTGGDFYVWLEDNYERFNPTNQ